jgi:hypothetical protein
MTRDGIMLLGKDMELIMPEYDSKFAGLPNTPQGHDGWGMSLAPGIHWNLCCGKPANAAAWPRVRFSFWKSMTAASNSNPSGVSRVACSTCAGISMVMAYFSAKKAHFDGLLKKISPMPN